jgi:hypothetical protein
VFFEEIFFFIGPPLSANFLIHITFDFGSGLQVPSGHIFASFRLLRYETQYFFKKFFVLIGRFGVPIIFFRILDSACKFVAFRSPYAKL